MPELPARYPIGLSDFRALREGGFSYVDKTGLVEAVLGDEAQVMLAPGRGASARR